MLKAELIDKNGYVVATVRQTENFKNSLGGIITIDDDDKFLAECYIKWDGCSHFWYNGEDSLYQEDDAYYHECGLNEYYKQFVAKLFAWEVAKYYMKNNVENIEKTMDDDLYNTIPKINILDFYTIKYSEIDIKNDFIYERYLENKKDKK